MKELIRNKRGLRCCCCGRVMKEGYRSIVSLNKFTCKFCWHNCESITGIPRCHFERKKIGGYWSDKRSNIFTRLDGTTEKRNQKDYF